MCSKLFEISKICFLIFTLLNDKKSKKSLKYYHVDFEKRKGCGVVARERYESHLSQLGELLAKAKQLKIFPLFKILTVNSERKLEKNFRPKNENVKILKSRKCSHVNKYKFFNYFQIIFIWIRQFFGDKVVF